MIAFIAGFSLELPIENRTAKGALAQKRSLVDEANLTALELGDAIASQVLIGYETLKSSVTEYRLTELSKDSYKKAVAFENQKYKSGESALNNVIDMEDRYLEARLASLGALSAYAIALAQLKWATGTLLDEAGGKFIFDPESILRF